MARAKTSDGIGGAVIDDVLKFEESFPLKKLDLSRTVKPGKQVGLLIPFDINISGKVETSDTFRSGDHFYSMPDYAFKGKAQLNIVTFGTNLIYAGMENLDFSISNDVKHYNKFIPFLGQGDQELACLGSGLAIDETDIKKRKNTFIKNTVFYAEQLEDMLVAPVKNMSFKTTHAIRDRMRYVEAECSQDHDIFIVNRELRDLDLKESLKYQKNVLLQIETAQKRNAMKNGLSR